MRVNKSIYNNKISHTVLLLFFSIQLFSQSATIDSLKNAIRKSKVDTVTINSLIELSWEFCYGGMYDSTIKYSNQTLQKTTNKKNVAEWNSKKAVEAFLIIGTTNLMKGDYDQSLLNFRKCVKMATVIDDKSRLARSFMNIGSVFLYKSEYDSAIYYYEKSLVVQEVLKDDFGVSDVYICLGTVYFNLGNYPKALKSFYSALKIKEKLKAENGISSCLNNIASIFLIQKKYVKALEMYNRSLVISTKVMDKQGMVNSLFNIGVLYYETNRFNEALESHINALKLYEEMEYMLGYSTSLENIGQVYGALNQKQEAINYFLKAVKIKIDIEDQAGLARCYINLGTIYTRSKNYTEAKSYFIKAQIITEQLGDLEKLQDLYFNFSILEESTKNFEKSLLYFQKYLTYRDSINAEENVKNALQTSMNYEFEKKEALTKAEQDKKDSLASIEMKKQQVIRYAVSGILVLVILFTLFLYNRFRLIRKQKNIIELKEKETQLQKHVIEEKHKEITDSINYAERIQRSFLASTEMLHKNLNSSLHGTIQSQTIHQVASFSADACNDDSNYFVLFKPKDVVSGDFYWAGELNNGNFALSCADSTGHGVPGAIMSILNISSLEKSIEHESEPHKILNQSRKIIVERLKKDGSIEGGKDGMDCSLLVFNKDKTQLSFAAANNPVFIVRPSMNETFEVIFELIEFKADKMPVGKHDKDNLSFTLQTVTLQKGDIIYTLTDGFPDQFGGEKGKKYMIKNLKALLLQIAHLSMKEQEQKLAQEFINWKGDNEQVDDVCVIGIKI